MKEALEKIEKMLAAVVDGGTYAEPVAAQKEMTPEQFVAYAASEITKAMGESRSASSLRLEALSKSIAHVRKNWEDDVSLKVPVYVPDTTAIEERENQIMTPAKSADMNVDNQSVFEQGFVAKLEGLLKSLEEGSLGNAEDDNTSKAKKADDEDEEKAKAKKADADWPDDMAGDAFLKKGDTSKPAPEWGYDKK